MSHQISTNNGRAEMFNAGFVPWHGLGTVVEEAQTVYNALSLAGLDWPVSQAPQTGRHPYED